MKPPISQQAAWSLLPLLLFIVLFLGTGLFLQARGVEYAFYQLPGPVAIIPALVLAIYLHKANLSESLEVLVRGAGSSNIITMCMIFLLAGAFATVAQASGGVDAMVNACLSIIHPDFLLPGLFAISALVATAMGTSMGTIGALAPIALGLANQAELEPALVAGVLLSGAIFGDNLSIISDTTIASTRTQGAEMTDKFRENIKIALPAALVTLAFLVFFTQDHANIVTQDFSWTGVVPYAAILILAVAGMNVFAVLLLGIVLAALQGAVFADYPLANLGKDIYQGFASMQEIFLLSMLVGALGEFVKQQGGLHYLSTHIIGLASKLKLAGHKAQQLAIAALVFVCNLCVANNTVAIVVVGEVSKDIAQQYQISPKRSASLLDIFACVAQGLVPYGAQALLLGSSFGLSPLEIVSHNYYCLILVIFAIAWVVFEKPKKI